MSEQSETSGVWRVCWPAFTALVPRAVLEDDEARLEVAEAFQLCAAVLNRPTDRMLPDTDEDD